MVRAPWASTIQLASQASRSACMHAASAPASIGASSAACSDVTTQYVPGGSATVNVPSARGAIDFIDVPPVKRVPAYTSSGVVIGRPAWRRASSSTRGRTPPHHES